MKLIAQKDSELLEYLYENVDMPKKRIKQYLTHGSIYVNNNKTTKYNYKLVKGMSIVIDTDSKNKTNLPFEVLFEDDHIIVVNKQDLEKKLDLSKYNLDNIIYTDTVSDSGINPLKDKIIELFNIDELDNTNDAFFTNERQITLAKEALSILDDVNKGIENDVPVDLIEIDIKRIWTKLGEILGENYDEELIDQLFSNFCLGK